MSADIQPTKFMESNALLALVADPTDHDAAREVLADATAGELKACAEAADELSDLCWAMYKARRYRGGAE